MNQKAVTKPAGRPPGKDNEQVRHQLLDAARSQFLSYEFKAVSVRRIGEQAGVNPAMVNYYFGSKQGLYVAMVEEMLAAMHDSLSRMDAMHGNSVPGFIRAYLEFLAENPWWPNFIVREVLFGKEQFRSQIVERFNRSMAQRLISAISREVDTGTYRSELDPRFTAWSLMGMIVFPFLSSPIAAQVINQKAGLHNISALIEHTTALFLHGASKEGDRS